MIKEAIEKILDLANIENRCSVIYGSTYSDRPLNRIKAPGEIQPAVVELNTLTGMRDFLIKESDPGMLIHVASYKEVRVIGDIQPSNDNLRFTYAVAKMGLPGYQFNQFIPLENFIIALQSQFVQTPEIEQILDHLGNLASESVKENKDDGFSQSIQVRVGIRTKSEVKITNPINLRPWRTFREIEQPESACVLRLRKERDGELACALFCADGDHWTLKAIADIKTWFLSNAEPWNVIA